MTDVSVLEAVRLIAALLATGAVAGILSGLLGVGGGIVIVPVLFVVLMGLGVDETVLMHVAIGTSLATIIFTGFMSARSHWSKGAVDTALLARWGPPIAIGVVAGTVVGGNIAGAALTLIFALIAAIVAVNMAVRPARTTGQRPMPGTPLREALGLGIGGFSVLMGIGGGTLTVPILSFFDYPIRRAVGTAAAIGLIIAVPGAIGFAWFGFGQATLPPFSIGYVNVLGVAAIVPASMLTAPLGARIAHAVAPAVLRWCFAGFLALTSATMIHEVALG
ncbi:MULTISPECIES: sulfite exporter TauE/SafE family protein [unclassified Roseitalea]|uniref:sulfite exporter TauE/SafE family protein n=1 Tax=unclassified Roseitalea TaxID=2639107 RepID=UPI00273D6DEE|nr:MULTISPECIES: sulfite exporter TauE/SafE family protein [unclassified Roseitalea]